MKNIKIKTDGMKESVKKGIDFANKTTDSFILKGDDLRSIKDLTQYDCDKMIKHDIKYYIRDLESAIRILKGYLK